MYMESNSCAETRTIDSGRWMVSLCKPMKRPLSVNILYTCKYPKHLELIAQICVNHVGGGRPTRDERDFGYASSYLRKVLTTFCYFTATGFDIWLFSLHQTLIYTVYMDSSSCEQTGHHCRVVQCLQKQEGSPKCTAH